MRVISLLLLLFLTGVYAPAQDLSTATDAPGIVVLEKKWRSEVRNPALEEDPLKVNEEQREQERAARQNQADNVIRARLGLPALPPPLPRPSTRPAMGKPTVEYVYQAKIKNTGTKAISRLVWEYVFFDPATQREVGRRRYESKVKIRPGKTESLTARSSSPPTGTVDAAQAGKKMKELYTEKVLIERIEYADGSFWSRPLE
jgi:hypothetical protein